MTTDSNDRTDSDRDERTASGRDDRTDSDLETDATGDESIPVDRTGPLSELATAADDRRSTGRKGSRDDGGGAEPASDPDLDGLFDREDVAEIDAERLWAELETDDDPPTGGCTDRDVRDVDSGSYCHQCEHFSEPPVVACTREGTDVLEMPALETFRVADCPVVREEERLERGR